MKKRIVYNNNIYTETDRKIIKYNNKFYLMNKDLIRIGDKRVYRPIDKFEKVDSDKVKEFDDDRNNI